MRIDAGEDCALLQEVGLPDGPAVLYFHGTSAQPDRGPTIQTVTNAGVRLFHFTRPGYSGTPALPGATLADVASRAVEAVVALGVSELVSVGWSGGGPYALASATVAPHVVLGVGLMASWAPMDPPHPGLPRLVRRTMSAARRLPRPALKLALAAAGRSSPGQLDDIRRIARPWGFTPTDVAQCVPVAAWHSSFDCEVPIAPWEEMAEVQLRRLTTTDHEPDADTCLDVLRWARHTLAG